MEQDKLKLDWGFLIFVKLGLGYDFEWLPWFLVFFIKEVSCSSSITISSRIRLKKNLSCFHRNKVATKIIQTQRNSDKLFFIKWWRLQMTKDHNSPLQLKEKINLKISFRLMWRILQRRQREIKKHSNNLWLHLHYFLCLSLWW